jgi:hypothetical protein
MRKERTQRSAAVRHSTVEEFNMFQLLSGVQNDKRHFLCKYVLKEEWAVKM